jgi:hypothetical protein
VPLEGGVQEALLDGHTLRAADVMIGTRGQDGEEIWVPAHEWAGLSGGRVAECVTVRLLSSKTDQHGGRPARFFVSGESSEPEAQLVRMVAQLAMSAGYSGAADLFLSRPSKTASGGGKRVDLRTSQVSALAKRVAAEAGLPPELFSAKSFKIGGITAVRASGASAEETAAAVGQHRSVAGSSAYVREVLEGETGALSAGSRLGAPPYSRTSLGRNVAAHLEGADSGAGVGGAGAEEETSVSAVGLSASDPVVAVPRPARVSARGRVAPRRLREEDVVRPGPARRSRLTETVDRHAVVAKLFDGGMRAEFDEQYTEALRLGRETPEDPSPISVRADGTAQEDGFEALMRSTLWPNEGDAASAGPTTRRRTAGGGEGEARGRRSA